MSVDTAIKAFGAVPTQRQVEVLAVFAHELTILCRATYEVGTDNVVDPRRLRQLTEVQHRVVGHLLKLLRGDEERYPDEVLIQIITDEGDESLLAAFAMALGEVTQAE